MLLLLQMGELKDLAQFLIREIDLLFISGSFQKAKSRFVRNAAQLGFRYAKKERGLGLRHKFGNIVAQVVHGLPLCVFALPRLLARGAVCFQILVLCDLSLCRLATVRWSASVSGQFVLGVKEVGAQRAEAARSRTAKIAVRRI